MTTDQKNSASIPEHMTISQQLKRYVDIQQEGSLLSKSILSNLKNTFIGLPLPESFGKAQSLEIKVGGNVIVKIDLKKHPQAFSQGTLYPFLRASQYEGFSTLDLRFHQVLVIPDGRENEAHAFHDVPKNVSDESDLSLYLLVETWDRELLLLVNKFGLLGSYFVNPIKMTL